MICPSCRDAHHDDCPGTGWCDCQHVYGRVAVITPDGQSSGARVLLGVHTPAPVCTCLEQVDLARGRVAIPPPAGCPEHGYLIRWVGAIAEPEPQE